MNLFKSITNYFSKSVEKDLETKSDGISECNSGFSIFSPYAFGSSNGIALLRNAQAWKYYEKISPIFDAVDRKSKAMTTIAPAIYDNVEKVYLREVDTNVPATQILEFLKTPNRDKTWIEFIKSIVPSIEVTGDIFIMVTSLSEESTPLEFYYINPADLVPVEGNDGRVKTWQLNNNQWNEKFHYKENSLQQISSYFTSDGMKELWQIKTFNSRESRGDFFGLSPLNPIFHEIEEYEYSNVNNTSVLKKGMRPSGVLIIDKEFNLTDAQYNRMRTQMAEKKSGAENAGDVLILEGGKDFKQLSQTNKDMEFMELIKFVREQIYITKGIPLPMITSTSMTMNNFEESKYMMYDSDVLPFANWFYDEMNLLFMRRYDQSGRYKLCYDPQAVPALKVKQSAVTDKKLNSKVITVDEGRDLLGYDPLPLDAGNVLLVPSSSVPVQNAGQVGSNIPPESKYDYTTPAGRYRKQLEELKNDDDERKYTDEQIDKKIKLFWGNEK